MLSLVLFPFAWLYGLVVGCRNFLYDVGIMKSYSFDQLVVSVGNLSVGGTGKTPMIEYLVKLLTPQYTVAILSRGYGRSTRGFRVADHHDDASTIGDEPFQFFRKFGKTVAVVVCESRVEGIMKLLKRNPNTQVILLDDAFQHRAVKPSFSVLLSDFSNPFFNDHLLPMGRLRESRAGSKRADVVIATKSNSVTAEMKSRFTFMFRRYAGEKPVFFTEIEYDAPVSISGAGAIGKNVVLVTGIGNSKPLEAYLSTRYRVVTHLKYNDHHAYSTDDITLIQKKITSPDMCIITTEKDMVKLISPLLQDVLDKNLWFYISIKTGFLNSGVEFDTLITDKIQTHLTYTLSQKPK